MENDAIMQAIQALGQQDSAQPPINPNNFVPNMSGVEGIGVGILAELARRGIDTSAADEAVQNIFDELRQEVSATLAKIVSDERAVSSIMDKVSKMEDAVATATGKQPDTGPDVAGSEPPPPEPIEGTGLAPEGGIAGGDPAAMGGAPPMDPGMGGDPAAMGGAPPADPSAGMPPADPNMVPSDSRLKAIRAKIKGRYVASDKNVKTWKPSKGMLATISGGRFS